MNRLLIFMLFLLLTGGASAKKIYHEGEDPLVADCADHCNVVKMKCRSQSRDQYEYCRDIYKRRVQEYNWCRNTGGSFCTKPDRCPIMQTGHCTNGYDSCFLSCGGTIEDTRKTKKEKKAAKARAKAAAMAKAEAEARKKDKPDS